MMHNPEDLPEGRTQRKKRKRKIFTWDRALAAWRSGRRNH
jgi:hypothetical protein